MRPGNHSLNDLNHRTVKWLIETSDHFQDRVRELKIEDKSERSKNLRRELLGRMQKVMDEIVLPKSVELNSTDQKIFFEHMENRQTVEKAILENENITFYNSEVERRNNEILSVNGKQPYTLFGSIKKIDANDSIAVYNRWVKEQNTPSGRSSKSRKDKLSLKLPLVKFETKPLPKGFSGQLAPPVAKGSMDRLYDFYCTLENKQHPETSFKRENIHCRESGLKASVDVQQLMLLKRVLERQTRTAVEESPQFQNRMKEMEIGKDGKEYKAFLKAWTDLAEDVQAGGNIGKFTRGPETAGKNATKPYENPVIDRLRQLYKGHFSKQPAAEEIIHMQADIYTHEDCSAITRNIGRSADIKQR